jgi:hypothetical protein
MNTQIYTIEKDNNRSESWINSGLFLASDPFNYTTNATSGIIISAVPHANEAVIAFDSLSDEIGIKHEIVEGEVVASDED